MIFLIFKIKINEVGKYFMLLFLLVIFVNLLIFYMFF